MTTFVCVSFEGRKKKIVAFCVSFSLTVKTKITLNNDFRLTRTNLQEKLSIKVPKCHNIYNIYNILTKYITYITYIIYIIY